MSLENGIFKLPKNSFFGMSDVLLGTLISASNEGYSRTRAVLYSPVFRASDLGSNYRFINYLESVGLMNDTRDHQGSGWRRINWTEHIYMLIVVEMRKFGLKAEIIKPFANLFLNDENSVALNSIMAVLGGVEMTIVIKANSTCAILDPTYMSFYEGEELDFLVPTRGAGEIQLKLSYFVNQLWIKLGKKPIEIREYYGKQQYEDRIKQSLSQSELEAIINMRKLSNNETMTVRRTKSTNEVLFDVEKALSIDDELAERIGSLVEGDFAGLNVVKRDGKVVGIKTSKTTKVKD